MATAARSRYAQTPKARNDAYTGLLFISFLALVASCIFLYLDYDQYGKSTPAFTPSVKSAATSLPGPTVPEAPAAPTTPMGGAAPMGGAPMGGAPMPMGGGPMPGGAPGLPVPGGAGGGGGAAPAPGGGGPPKTTLLNPMQDSPAIVVPSSDTLELPPLSPSKSNKSGSAKKVHSAPN